MTVISRGRRAGVQSASRFSWVPAAAGWIVGVIATLSLIASVSPAVRWLIQVPREFVNDYIFNFPDTSFAWAFVLALLAAALAARKRIAWWILVLYMVGAIGWNLGDLAAGGDTLSEDVGEVIGVVFHVAAIAALVLARNQFWAKVRRGALLKSAVVLVAGMAIGILAAWGLLELFPGTLAPEWRLLYAVNRVSGFATVPTEVFEGYSHTFLNAIFGLFGALALMTAAIVLFQSQRATNALTGE
ncbi:lysine--tRNA ligase, partial [Mycolicibacterium fortuitum]